MDVGSLEGGGLENEGKTGEEGENEGNVSHGARDSPERPFVALPVYFCPL